MTRRSCPLYAVHGDAREFHFLTGWRDAHVLPPVGSTAPPASYHLIPLGYEVLYGAYHVREASAEIGCLLLGSLDVVGGKELFCGVEVSGAVPELFLLPTHQGTPSQPLGQGRST